MEIRQRETLRNYTSWQIGGKADFFCVPENFPQLRAAVEFAMEKSLPVQVLSGGSNVLISDQGIAGLTVCLKKFAGVQTKVVKDDLVIECDAGLAKSELLKIYLKYKLKPALFLAGIPGDVGGGIVMNAGVSENIAPREFCEIVESFEVMKWKDGTVWTESFLNDRVKWTYRHSEGWQNGIISRVRLKVPNLPDANIMEAVRFANKSRLSKQPLDKPSCGSVFKNPEGHKAAQLIESAGLKGLQMGDAQVSLKHANFIVNLGQATARDTWNLMCEVQKKVFEKHQVQLTTEVVRLGRWDDQ
jgi:UDP-N-acetylmuramate dehydrogenase